ncbi:MAG: DEAD/DEAH box helicase [Alphaproteobacteria bacterium]|nr:DEAD/DEAH box helicase [Alphaproteobacteria bacterium]
MAITSNEDSAFARVAEALEDLPVAKVAGEVVESVEKGNVTILTSETGSGKTLLANSMLAEASDDQVLVLVPRRSLAKNAAEAVANIAGVEVGGEVGYAIGQQAGEKSQFTKDTKLVFATYDYALSSGMINTAKTVVADEVHEASASTSLARALLHKRKENEPDLRIAEMSATVNAGKQAGFWKDIANVETYHADGVSHECEYEHVSIDADSRESQKNSAMGKAVVDLMENKGSNGVAVFRSGVKEVEGFAEHLRETLKQSEINDVEVATIYGEMGEQERNEALAAPKEGNRKVIVGTNVIESGFNIEWLDAGVSDGETKLPYYRKSGAEALVKEDMPQWRIVQQQGRVNRFREGSFVLCSATEKEDREEQQGPELERVALNNVLMHTANMEIDPTELKFDAKIEPWKMKDAKEQLSHLGLLTDDLKLTDTGKFVHRLPMGPEAGKMVFLANGKENRDDIITLAAIVDAGGLRDDYRRGHGQDDTSDMIDAFKAYKELGDAPTSQDLQQMNISRNRYDQVAGTIEETKRRLEKEPQAEQREATQRELQMAILSGSMNHLFDTATLKETSKKTPGNSYKDMVHPDDKRSGMTGYEGGRYSVVSKANEDRYAVGKLIEVKTKKGAISIVQNISKIPRDVMVDFIADNPEVLTNKKVLKNERRSQITGSYLGGAPITLNVGENAPEKLKELLSKASAPQGVGNSKVQEHSPPKVLVNA